MTIEQKVKSIKEDLDFFEDDLAKYEYIIELGKKLEPLQEDEKIPKNLVHGCTSQVWLTYENKDGMCFFKGTSDAIIVKGLVYIILDIFSNRSLEEINEVGTEILYDLDLAEIVTPSRQSGLIGMIKKIKQYTS